MKDNKRKYTINNFEFEKAEKEIKIDERHHITLFVVVFIMLIFISQLDYIIKYSFNEVEEPPNAPISVDALATPTENINNNTNSKLSTMSNNQRTFIAEIINYDDSQYLHIISAYGEFKVPIYTLRDYDIDKGLIPKDFNSYPEIKVNVVGTLSTHGVLIETQQNIGYQTYANKVYIRGSKVVDVGFQKRLTKNDTIKYYDNAILIVDTLNTTTEDFVRVYDDETGAILFKLNMDDFNIDKGYLDSLRFSSVGDHFISYSTKYNGEVEDAFVCFDGPEYFEIKSVWDSVEATDIEIQSLKDYELNTNSDCITFSEYNDDGELVYKIKYLNGHSESEVRINIDEFAKEKHH